MYWHTSLIGYVLREQVPFTVMEGFVKSQWKGVNSPQVLLHDQGYFVFRFESSEDRRRILEDSWYIRFKPLALRDWIPDLSFVQNTTEDIPVWINLPNFDMQY